jgi:hypothetical protein
MFEWLKEEMARIKTRKFHLVDGPLPDDRRALIEQTELAVPPSYKQFVVQFGHAQLYRQNGIYLVEIFPTPRDAKSSEGECLLHFGRTDLSISYFKNNLLVASNESPIFEWRHDRGLRKTADGFEEWLTKKCKSAKGLFSKRQWSGIEAGPPPFSEKEQEIMEARRHYRWRALGPTESGDMRFEVSNGSKINLPYLTIGVRGKLRDKSDVLEGGAWLPIAQISPGQTQVVETNCYKDLVDPKDVETYAEPDPDPEDRELYWEFRALSR